MSDLQLLDVLGQITACHALVHMFVAGESVEFLNAGLDVVARHPFAGADGLQVDVLKGSLVVGDRRLGYVDTEFALRPQHRQPQPTFGDDLGLR